MMKTRVSFLAMPAPGDSSPYPSAGGMTSSRRPPTRMPTTPSAQPAMTLVELSVKVKGVAVHEDCTTLPLPSIRLVDSSVVGGAPLGMIIVGALPHVPAGDGSTTGLMTTGTVVV